MHSVVSAFNYTFTKTRRENREQARLIGIDTGKESERGNGKTVKHTDRHVAEYLFALLRLGYIRSLFSVSFFVLSHNLPFRRYFCICFIHYIRVRAHNVFDVTTFCLSTFPFLFPQRFILNFRDSASSTLPPTRAGQNLLRVKILKNKNTIFNTFEIKLRVTRKLRLRYSFSFSNFRPTPTLLANPSLSARCDVNCLASELIADSDISGNQCDDLTTTVITTMIYSRHIHAALLFVIYIYDLPRLA